MENDIFLQADSFMIVSEGEVFVGNSDKFSVKSDPPTSGDPNYTTLEVMWAENDQEMRFLLTFIKISIHGGQTICAPMTR